MRLQGESGFTLIELMVVTVIISILAALAISNYSLYKANGYNTMAASDLRNMLPAVELASSEGGTTPNLLVINRTGGPVPQLEGVNTSKDILGFVEVNANDFFIELEHFNGTLKYEFDSDGGGWAVVAN